MVPPVKNNENGKLVKIKKVYYLSILQKIPIFLYETFTLFQKHLQNQQILLLIFVLLQLMKVRVTFPKYLFWK